MKKLRRFKNRLNEDDTTAAQQPAQQPQEQPQQQQPAAQPQQTAQPQQQQPAEQQPAQQTQQQPVQQPQQPTQQQSQEQQQAGQFLATLRDNIEKKDIYWALAFNLADALQQAVPTFKNDNPDAKPGIDAWESFKKTPNEQTFNQFADTIAKFGAPKPAPEQQAEQAQQAQQVNDSLVMQFGARLEEKLSQRARTDFYARCIRQGLED